MFSHHVSKKKEIFDLTCEAVKEKNLNRLFGNAENGIEGLLQQALHLGLYADSHLFKSVLIFLAKQGDVESVSFLLNDFEVSIDDAVYGYAVGGHVVAVNDLIVRGASKNFAVYGYAEGGYVEKVNELMTHRKSLDFAVEGYALGGHVHEVNRLIDNGANLYKAIFGYALGGHVQEVNELIVRCIDHDLGYDYPANYGLYTLAQAVHGYAQGGHVKEVNELVCRGADIYSAIKGYAAGGHITVGNLLWLMSNTDDPYLRAGLSRSGKHSWRGVDSGYLKPADKINRIMREYHLDYDQAISLATPETIIWLLQGTQLVRNAQYGIVADIFFQVSAMTLGLSIDSTKIVFDAVHDRFSEIFKTSNDESVVVSYLKHLFNTENSLDRIQERCDERRSVTAQNNRLFATASQARKLDELDVPELAIGMYNIL